MRCFRLKVICFNIINHSYRTNSYTLCTNVQAQYTFIAKPTRIAQAGATLYESITEDKSLSLPHIQV
ncbi:hypothetical protein [Pontibacter sp. H249]|uniref:hypothetical protein n=1 Tax=Pontibacter sp. H249 TaxID=3133420 RepID=UPI0030BEC10B